MEEVESDTIDYGWWEELKKDTFTWEMSDQARYYKRPETYSYLVVLPEQNILLKIFSTMGGLQK